MRVRVILPCGRRKAAYPCAAWRLYQGAYFRAALGWAQSVAGRPDTYILSAKYGLVTCDTVLAPYDAKAGTDTQQATPVSVAAQVDALRLNGLDLVLVGGLAYERLLSKADAKVHTLSAHMGTPDTRMGYQMGWLTDNKGKLPGTLYDQLTRT